MNADVRTSRANVPKLMDFESALFAAHELEKLLDEDMTEEARELEGVEAIGGKFLAWDLNETTMDKPLKEFVVEMLSMMSDD